MASRINSISTGTGGLITTADVTGALELQTEGNTALTISNTQNVTVASNLIVAGNTTVSGTLSLSSTSTLSNLNVNGVLRLYGATSGFVGLSGAANAGGTIFTLPASDGLNGQVLQTNGTGSLSWINQSVGGGGGGGGSGTSTSRTAFTATEGQTTFSVTYTVGQIDVFMNGLKLIVGTDVTASNGTSIILAAPAKAGDILDTVVYSSQWITNGTNLYYNTGSVGIGTDSPGAKLSLGSEASTRKLLVYDGGNNATYVGFGTPDTANLNMFTFTGGNIRFGEWGSGGAFVERMVLNSSGNLGLGTTSPTNIGAGYSHLEVNGTNTGVISVSANGVRGLTLSADNSAANIQARVSGQSLTFSANNAGVLTEHARITSAGSFRIGTTGDPGGYNAKLIVEQTGANNGVIINTTTSAANLSLTFRNSNADSNALIINGTGGSMVFLYNSSTEGMRLNSSGNLGLGTKTPTARLDVSGNQAGNIVSVAALDIDCSSGNYFTKTIAGDSTFTFSNPPASRSYGFTLELTHTSGAVTWPATVKWPGDATPSLTTGKTHLFVFVTDDGGTRWRGSSLVNYTN